MESKSNVRPGGALPGDPHPGTGGGPGGVEPASPLTSRLHLPPGGGMRGHGAERHLWLRNTPVETGSRPRRRWLPQMGEHHAGIMSVPGVSVPHSRTATDKALVSPDRSGRH